MDRFVSSTCPEAVPATFDDDPSVVEGFYAKTLQSGCGLMKGLASLSLDSQFEKLLELCDRWLVQKLFYSGRSTESSVKVVRTCTILVLIVLPINILYRLTDGTNTWYRTALSIQVILVFTLCFSVSISLFTGAKRHEILASAAAYCAVLVVFIGNIDR